MSPGLVFSSCLAAFLLLLVGAQQQQQQQQRRAGSGHQRPLLVVLLDGFRYDYTDELQQLPGFGRLLQRGVKVDYMTPDFPSLSYPNYYSLMTVGENSDPEIVIKRPSEFDLADTLPWELPHESRPLQNPAEYEKGAGILCLLIKYNSLQKLHTAVSTDCD